MTTIYQWHSFPKTFSVECPNCGAEALGRDVPSSKTLHGHTTVSNHSKGEIKGSFVCKYSCLSCGAQKKQMINWPQTAFWKFQIKNEYLWAWSEDHAKEILNYIRSEKRNPFGSGYASSLLHIPTVFKLAKNRKAAVKAIQEKLNAGI